MGRFIVDKETGEYILMTMEQIQDHASKNGWQVVFPKSTEVQIDIDNKRQYYQFWECFDTLVSKHLPGARIVRNAPSKSGRQFKLHIVVDTGMELTEGQRIALQFALGSDPVRESLNIIEHLMGMETSTLFYEKAYSLKDFKDEITKEPDDE